MLGWSWETQWLLWCAGLLAKAGSTNSSRKWGQSQVSEQHASQKAPGFRNLESIWKSEVISASEKHTKKYFVLMISCRNSQSPRPGFSAIIFSHSLTHPVNSETVFWSQTLASGSIFTHMELSSPQSLFSIAFLWFCNGDCLCSTASHHTNQSNFT